MKTRSWTMLLSALFAVSAVGQPSPQALSESLRGVINTGVKLFNDNGDHVGCYRLFHGSLLSIKPLVADELQRDIDACIARAEGMAKYDDRAFELRGCLDRVRAKLKADTAPVVLPPPTPEVKQPAPPVIEEKKPTVTLPTIENKPPPPLVVEEKKPLPPLVIEEKKPLPVPPLVEEKKPLPPPLPVVEEKKPLPPLVPPPVVEEKKPLPLPPPVVEEKKPLPPLVPPTLTPLPPPPLPIEKKSPEVVPLPKPAFENKTPVVPPLPPEGKDVEPKVPPAVVKGKVYGKVTFQGKPIPAGTTTIDYKDQPRPAAYLVFIGEQGQRLSTAINMDGSYAFKVAIAPGMYKVAIEAAPETTIDPTDDIPARYRSADSTTLMVEVSAGPQTLDLTLVK